jgi:hypothetical protein
MDRLQETRWDKFPGLPAGEMLRVFLDGAARQAKASILLNIASLERAKMIDGQDMRLLAVPAAGNASVGQLLQRALQPLDLTFIPHVANRGDPSLEVLTNPAADAFRYTLIYNVSDLAGNKQLQVLITAIRQTVGRPVDWAAAYNPITGQSLNPVDDGAERIESNNLAVLTPLPVLQVKAPWRLQEGMRDYFRKLRVAKGKP